MKRTLTPALAAFFAGRPIEPIGFLPNGRPVFPIAGGAEDGDGAGAGKSSGGADDFKPITTAEEMSRFLAEKDLVISQRVAREREKYADYDSLKTKAAEYDKAIEAARTDQEKAVEAAKAEGRTEALTTANARLLSAEARALAAEAKFASPALAVRALDLSGVKVNDDGSVDADAIKSKLKELAESGAFVIETGEKSKPKPDRAQGGAAAKGDKSVSAGRDLFEQRRAKKTPASQ